jgi:hypothetical protein
MGQEKCLRAATGIAALETYTMPQPARRLCANSLRPIMGNVVASASMPRCMTSTYSTTKPKTPGVSGKGRLAAQVLLAAFSASACFNSLLAVMWISTRRLFERPAAVLLPEASSPMPSAAIRAGWTCAEIR